MEVSAEIRQKLATLIGHLICRCIREARMIPYVLNRDEVINILVDDPARFERLVQDEHAADAELSKTDLTVHMDAVAELGKLDMIETFDQSFWDGPEVDLKSILELTNQLTRTFSVYLGNAATLFDKAFEEFMDKFRESVHRGGMELRQIDFTPDDVALLESRAMSLLSEGELLQAFTYDRLLTSQIMIRKVVNMPSTGFMVRENLIWRALNDPRQFQALTKFVLRVTYISHGAWDDLFPILVGQIYRDSAQAEVASLIGLIERDIVFLCNLLCRSYGEIRELSPEQRRQAIEESLRKCLEIGGLS
jgi:hypothetical protein